MANQVSEIVSEETTLAVKQDFLKAHETSEEFVDKVFHESLLLAGPKKQAKKAKRLNDFRLNTEFIQITEEEARIIENLYSELEQEKSSSMELIGAQITIVRSKVPGLINETGVLYEETPSFVSILFSDGRCKKVKKDLVDFVSEGVYFIGKARNSRYKKLKQYTM